MEYDYSAFGGLNKHEANGITGDVNNFYQLVQTNTTIVCDWIKGYES